MSFTVFIFPEWESPTYKLKQWCIGIRMWGKKSSHNTQISKRTSYMLSLLRKNWSKKKIYNHNKLNILGKKMYHSLFTRT